MVSRRLLIQMCPHLDVKTTLFLFLNNVRIWEKLKFSFKRKTSGQKMPTIFSQFLMPEKSLLPMKGSNMSFSKSLVRDEYELWMLSTQYCCITDGYNCKTFFTLSFLLGQNEVEDDFNGSDKSQWLDMSWISR